MSMDARLAPLAINEDELLVLATGKQLTLEVAIALLGLKNAILLDPESQLVGDPEETNEPKTDNSQVAVLFKLEQILKHYRQSLVDGANEIPKEVSLPRVMAADVILKINNEVCHRLNRDSRVNDKFPNLKEAKLLAQRYCYGPFTAEWQLAFGAAENGAIRIGKFSVVAEFPKLSPEMVLSSYNPLTSAGIELLELYRQFEGIEFRLKLDQQDEGIPISSTLAEQLIVAKVPTREMVNQLFTADAIEQPEGYALLAFAITDIMNQRMFAYNAPNE